MRLGPRRDLDCERVAHVVQSKRKGLLWAYRYSLRRADLEECFGQASMELIRYVRAGGSFSHVGHAAAALELRFVSRVQDRRRALAGRSPVQAVWEGALAAGSLGEAYTGVADVRCTVEELAMMRMELRLVPVLARGLTPDQRLVLACQVGLQMGRLEFCELFGWSFAKYRKVARRASERMRALSEQVDENKLDGDAPMRTPPPAHGRFPGGSHGRPAGLRSFVEPQARNGGRGPSSSPLRPSVAEAPRSERAA